MYLTNKLPTYLYPEGILIFYHHSNNYRGVILPQEKYLQLKKKKSLVSTNTIAGDLSQNIISIVLIALISLLGNPFFCGLENTMIRGICVIKIWSKKITKKIKNS
jgi:hypothetical protein